MRVNYNGLHAHSLRTLWVSPFLADVEWGIGRRDPSQGTDFCAAKRDAVVASVFWIAMIPDASAGARQVVQGRWRYKPSCHSRTQIERCGDPIGTNRGAGKWAQGGALSAGGNGHAHRVKIPAAEKTIKPWREENRQSAN